MFANSLPITLGRTVAGSRIQCQRRCRTQQQDYSERPIDQYGRWDGQYPRVSRYIDCNGLDDTDTVCWHSPLKETKMILDLLGYELHERTQKGVSVLKGYAK
jgi:hypothetical protein